MPGFTKGPGLRTPFGVTTFLRSTQDVKTESYTVAATTIPSETVDTVTGQKRLRKGEVLAKITSGGETGKVGPFQAGATDGRQTLANIVGINNTELPWQLMERDVEVAAVYECTAYQARCTELDSGGLRIALTNTTADAMRSTRGLDIMFK